MYFVLKDVEWIEILILEARPDFIHFLYSTLVFITYSISKKTPKAHFVAFMLQIIQTIDRLPKVDRHFSGSLAVSAKRCTPQLKEKVSLTDFLRQFNAPNPLVVSRADVGGVKRFNSNAVSKRWASLKRDTNVSVRRLQSIKLSYIRPYWCSIVGKCVK